MIKKILTVVFIFTIPAAASNPPVEKATGIFLSIGVGPRLPVGDFSTSTSLGYGFNIELSYTDNEYLPVFLFAKIGFEQYPGAQGFYQTTDYSSFSTSVLPVNIGARYYFPPMLENIVLLMPIVEVSASYAFYEKSHQFKLGSGRSNYLEDISKFGFSIGAGASMFMMEILASYNYFKSNQHVLFDFKVRIPLYINF